ncbi:polar growth protein, partial [Tulasnella sp. UAMH 9824]
LEIPSKTNPVDWTVDQVVEWLKSKKFDDGIVAKFIEHEITGDVLLELDVNMLKELDITAFGQRMRISKAINELKRSVGAEQSPGGALNGGSGFTMPPTLTTSFNSFNAGPISNGSMQNYFGQQPYQTSPSPALSQNPFAPGQAYGYPPAVPVGSQGPPSSTHTRTQSMSSMAPSGFGGDTVATDATSVTGAPQIPAALLAQLTDVPEEVNKASLTPDTGAGMSASVSAPSLVPTPKADEEAHVVLRKGSLRSKPPLSTLTPVDRSASGVVPVWAGGQSQTTLSSMPKSAATDPARPDHEPETDVEGPPRKSVDERATMSDGEATGGGLKDLKRRMSTRKAVRESGASLLSVGSEERAATPLSSVAASPSLKGSVFGGSIGARRKRNSDEGTANGSASGKTKGDRLSFFGGTLGKGRKPVPSEYSDTSPTVSSIAEKAHTHRSLSSRLHLGSQGRKNAVRPAPSPGSGESQSMPSSPAARLDAVATTARTPSGSGGLRKQILSSPPETTPSGRRPAPPPPAPLELEAKPGMTALDQIGQPDHSGWMRKRGESFNAWKLRYFVLKGPHLYYVKTLNESKIKGYINITGYKVIADENVHPGRYGFRIVHDTEKPHYFSSVEQTVVREWMKALMKATIDRDYSRPVVSSCNIPTIPLSIAQTMNPPPRPPSPTARAATQRAMRRENTNQLSSRDALVLMGMAGEPDSSDKARLDNFFRDHQAGDP